MGRKRAFSAVRNRGRFGAAQPIGAYAPGASKPVGELGRPRLLVPQSVLASGQQVWESIPYVGGEPGITGWGQRQAWNLRQPKAGLLKDDAPHAFGQVSMLFLGEWRGSHPQHKAKGHR